MIAESIVKTIGAMDPPGRFLAKDPKRGGLWFSIGSDRAREKASQALRENSQRVREEIEQETMQKQAEESMPPAMPSLQPRHYPPMEHHQQHPGVYSYGMPHPHHAYSHPAGIPPGAAPGWGYPYYPASINGAGAYEQTEKQPSSAPYRMYSAFPDAAALGYNMAHPLTTEPPLPSIPMDHHDHRVPDEEQQDATATPSAHTETRSEGETNDLLLSAAESWPLVAPAVSMSPISKTKKYATLNTQQSHESMATPSQDGFLQGLQQIFSATSFDPMGTSFSNEEMYPEEGALAQQPRSHHMDAGLPQESHHSKRRLSLSYVAKEEADMYPKAPKLHESSYEEQDPNEPLDLNMASPSSPNPSMVQQPIYMDHRVDNLERQQQHVCSLTPVGASCFSALEDMLRFVGSSTSGDFNTEEGTYGGFSTNASTAAIAGDGSFTSSFSSSTSRRGSMEEDSTVHVFFSPRAA